MATLAIVNPRRRRRSRKARKAHSRKRRSHRAHKLFGNPKKRRRSRGRKARFVSKRRSRGGSSSLSIRGLISESRAVVKSAAPAAVGAVALDILWAHLPLPAVVRAGYVQFVAKGAGAVLLGVLAGKFLGREVGHKVALGGVTVVLYNLTRQLVGSMLPGVSLGDSDFPGSMGYYGSAPVAGMGEYVNALPDYYGSGYSTTGNFAGAGEYVNGYGDDN